MGAHPHAMTDRDALAARAFRSQAAEVERIHEGACHDACGRAVRTLPGAGTCPSHLEADRRNDSQCSAVSRAVEAHILLSHHSDRDRNVDRTLRSSGDRNLSSAF